ncbi:MAG: hypothetical protein ACLROI_07100 [Beduini sp.]|uniref:hypothetical protein n=1 Tax=Beduini sp. TaxID=1922300 RepID=UPI00399088A0
MKLNIYKNQKEIERTIEVDQYDIMFGTIEDILSIMDQIDLLEDDEGIYALIKDNLPKIKGLLKDIFIGVTDDELKRIKIKELVPLFQELMTTVNTSIGGDTEKN